MPTRRSYQEPSSRDRSGGDHRDCREYKGHQAGASCQGGSRGDREDYMGSRRSHQELQRGDQRRRSSSRDRSGRGYSDRRDYRGHQAGASYQGGRGREDYEDYVGSRRSHQEPQRGVQRYRSSSRDSSGRDYKDRYRGHQAGANYEGGRSRRDREDRSPKRRREETPPGNQRDKRARAGSPGGLSKRASSSRYQEEEERQEAKYGKK